MTLRVKRGSNNGKTCGSCFHREHALALCRLWATCVADNERCPDWSDGKVERRNNPNEDLEDEDISVCAAVKYDPERRTCEWCKGHGTVIGTVRHKSYRCTDCDGLGYQVMCPECNQPMSPSEWEEHKALLETEDCFR